MQLELQPHCIKSYQQGKVLSPLDLAIFSLSADEGGLRELHLCTLTILRSPTWCQYIFFVSMYAARVLILSGAIASSTHPPSLILPLFIVIRQRLLRIRLGLKPLFDGAFREAVKSQTGKLVNWQMLPTQIKRLRVQRASRKDILMNNLPQSLTISSNSEPDVSPTIESGEQSPVETTSSVTQHPQTYEGVNRFLLGLIVLLSGLVIITGFIIWKQSQQQKPNNQPNSSQLLK